MGNSRKLMAGVTTLALLMAVPGTAFAVPDAPPLPSSQSVAGAFQRTKVIVTLEKQPSTPGGKGASLADVSALASSLADKYGLEVDRKFGYLVNAFSAYVDTASIPALRNEPGVAAVDKVRMYYPTMQTAADLTQSRAASEKYSIDGAGMVVSIIDTGIDMGHKDMRLDAGAEKKLQAADGFTDKVPYGYNFADENNEVKDTTSSQHGMHVAGIVAANGGKDAEVVANSRMNGIAPNAQLLAMKVFSNDSNKSEGAAADDIMAAVEDSVKHGADVINMSLGSPNGHDGQSVGEQRAIANARAAGVEVIVAAGNEGQNGSPAGENNDALGMLDDGTVGTPSTGTDAWSVASIENTQIVNTEGIAKGNGKEEAFPYDLQVGDVEDRDIVIVDGGYGAIDDIMPLGNLKGKYVLIQRGGAPGTDPLTFADKFTNAKMQGAEGVVLYNHATGGEDLPGMAGIDKMGIVGVAIGHTDGEKIKAMIAADSSTTVKLTKKNKIRTNPAALQPSAFTSWGSSPELGFKPQIAGIGGNVYSTLNDDKYGTKSGTSMAAPHVAGVSALMLQQAAKDFPDKSVSERILRNRIALANTAKILMVGSSNTPYAPRQIGAGLVQTENALKTRVLATVKDAQTGDQPNAALKEVKGSETFTVTLTNESDTARTFTTGSTCVVNESNAADGSATVTTCSAADSIQPSVNQVVVGPKSSATVDYTLTVGTGDHWVEGWVTFASDNEAEQPNISLPYLGFAGDWNKEPIIDNPSYTGFADPLLKDLGSPTQTALYTKMGAESIMTLADDQRFISPNKDGFADEIYAGLAMLRDAKKLTVSILDANHQVVRVLGSKDEVTRATIKAATGNQRNTFQEDLSSMAWDGQVYNAQKADFENAPDGKYIYRVSAQLGDEWAPQNLDIPFGVDTTAPEVEILSVVPDADGNFDVTVKATDADSGVNAVQGLIIWPPQMISGTETATPGVYTVKIPGAFANIAGYFELYVSDSATNFVRKTVMVGSNAFTVESDRTLNEPDLVINATKVSDQTDDLLVQNGKLVLTGHASELIKQVRIGGVVVDVEPSGRFRIESPVKDGQNDVVVEALDANGNVVATKDYHFTYDGEAPAITITVPASGPAAIENGKVHLEGTVKDNLGAVSTISIEGDDYPVNPDGTFSVDVPVDPSADTVTLRARDGVWNMSTKVVMLDNPNAEEKSLEMKANLAFNLNFNVVSGENEDLHYDQATDTYTFTYKGVITGKPTVFEVDGKPVTVNPDGSFETTLTLKQGISSVNVKLQGKDADVSTSLKVFLDTKAPNLKLTEPNISEDGAIYLKNPGDVTFAGTVSDNAFGYNLSINGNAVENFLSLDDPEENVNKRDFSTKVPAADGDTLMLLLSDQIDNVYLQLIPVIIDAVAPEIAFQGVTEGEVVEPTRTITAVVKDEHLKDARFLLDGVEVDAKNVTLQPAEGSLSVVKEGLGGTLKPVPPTGRTATASAAGTVRTTADDAGASAGTAATDPAAVAAVAGTEPAPAPQTGEGYTVLSATLPTPLASGVHTFSVSANDRAGNPAAAAVSFRVNAGPTIEGPDQMEVDPEAGDPAEQILKAMTFSDDTDAPEAIVSSVDASQLVLGQEVTVTVTARDSEGTVSTKEVKVTLQYPERTITKNGVSYTARMPKAAALSAERTDVAGGQKIAVSGMPVADAGKWVVTSDKPVAKIFVTDSHGRRLQVNAVLTEKGYEFVAPSASEIELVYQTDAAAVSTTKVGKNIHTGKGKRGLAFTGAAVSSLMTLAVGLAAVGVLMKRRRDQEA